MLNDIRTQLKAHMPLSLFLAVWVPCCTSDTVSPLLFAKRRSAVGGSPRQAEEAYRAS